MSACLSDRHPAARIYVGCQGLGSSPEDYFWQLSCVELQQTFVCPPKPRALLRLRERAPEDFMFIVRAWQLITHEASSPSYRQLPREIEAPAQAVGHFAPTEVVQQATERTLRAAAALAAPAVLFETPATFTPTVEHRRRLSQYFERLDRAGRAMVWDARGVWSLEEKLSLAADLDLVLAFDPLVNEPPTLLPGPLGYVRLPGLMAARPYPEDQLSWLADALQTYERAFCIFGGTHQLDAAIRLQDLLYEG